MNRIKYTLYNGCAYLTDAELSGGDTLEIIADSKGVLTLGKIRMKMTEGVGRVKISALSDGIYDCALIVGGDTVRLDSFRIMHGAVKIYGHEKRLAELSREVLDLKIGREHIEDDLKRLSDAVFGKKIF